MKALVQELCQSDFLTVMFVTRGGGKKNSEEERNNDKLSNKSSHFPLVTSLSLLTSSHKLQLTYELNISLVLFVKYHLVPSLTALPIHKLELTGFSMLIFTYAASFNAVKLRNKKLETNV